MPIDSSIPLNAQAPQPTNALTVMAQVQGIKDAQQRSQMNAMTLRQGQYEFAAQQAQDAAWKGALKPDGSIDTGALQGALAASGHGSAIPTVMKHVADAQKIGLDLQKQRQDIATQQADYAGSFAAASHAAGDDPNVFLIGAQHALQNKLVDPNTVGPIIQTVQKDPSSLGRINAQLIAQSPKQQELLSAATTAGARKENANTQADKWGLQKAAQQLGAAQDQQTYSQVWNQLPAGVARNFDPPENWNAQTTPQKARMVGMTPEQQANQGKDQYSPTSMTTSAGSPLVFDRQSGRYIPQANITGLLRPGQEDNGTGSGGPGSMTPDAVAKQARENVTDYQNFAKMEGPLNLERMRLGSALTSGNSYIDDKGRLKPIDPTKQTQDQTREQQADMAQRFIAASNQLKQILSQKNDALLRAGQQPQTSTEQAITALDQGTQSLITSLKQRGIQISVPSHGSSAVSAVAPKAPGDESPQQSGQGRYREGDVVSNGKGQKLVLRNNRWVPLQ